MCHFLVYIYIWVTCLFVKEILRGACTDLPESFCTAFFRAGDHSQGIGIRFFYSFFFEILIYFFVHNFIQRGRATRTWATTTSLQQKHWRAARKAGGKLWPAVNDWRTHFALFILQIIHISFNIHNSSENTNNWMQHTDYTPSAILFPSITSVCVCVIDTTVSLY